MNINSHILFNFEYFLVVRFLDSDITSILYTIEHDLIYSVDDMSLASRSQSMEDGMDEDVFRRSHRLSLPGHSQRMTNYLKFLQELAVRQAMGGGLNSQLFSTAVISGSSSSPNLGPGNTCRNIGEDGTPTIRPLETLHNALSLRQIDNFLDHVTSTNFRPRNSSSKETEEKMES